MRLLVLIAGFLFFLISSDLKAQLPSDFEKVELLGGLSNTTTMKFAPDGRLFMIDRYGELLLYRTDTQVLSTAGTLSVSAFREDGLIGLALDPNFSSNNYLYLHYSPVSESVNRVSRFTMQGDILDLTSEVVVLEWATDRGVCCHSAGDMAFDSMGNLYITTGDNTNHTDYTPLDETDSGESAENTSSNTNDLRGKILRITPQPDGSYTIPSGNLFPGGSGGLPEIYVMGARNPYSLTVDRTGTDWLFWGDVGPDADTASPTLGPEGLDEINLTKAAQNAGWPYFSGADNDAYQITYANPTYYNLPAAPENNSVWNTGATVLPPAAPAWLEFFHACYMVGPRYTYNSSLSDPQRMPSDFNGRLFYYDLNTSQIWSVAMDAQGTVTDIQQLAPSVFPSTRAYGFIDMEFGPDGFLYILEYGTGWSVSNNQGTGRLVRVNYTGIESNSPPVVSLTADVTNGPLPLTVNFSSAGTTDPEGDSPLIYSWDFTSDGFVDSNEENPSFTYTEEGTYNVQLRVDDGNGGIGVKSVTIYAGNSPASFTFVSPPDGGFFDWSDDFSLDLLVEDPEEGSTSDGGIDCNDVIVVPSLGHLTHVHESNDIGGCPKTVNLDPVEHNIYGDADLYYVFGARYTDSGGLVSFGQLELHPKRAEAEFYDQASGVTRISNSDPWGGGTEAIRVDSDGYIVLEGRNLFNIDGLRYRVASSAGGSIEMRVGGAAGTLLATTTIPAGTGGDDWQDIQASITDPGGKNDLYFVFTGSPGGQDIFDLNYIEFQGDGVSTDTTPPEVLAVEPQTSTEVWVEYSEQLAPSTAQDLANYSIDNGVDITSAVLQPDNRTVALTTSVLSSGTLYNITISGVTNQAGIAIVSGSYPISDIDPIRINSGGPQVTTAQGNYLADLNFNGGATFSTTAAISGTPDQGLYQSERYGSSFSYEVPVAASGAYDIRLHFAEIFYGLPGGGSGGGPGSRIFDVTIEGNLVLDNFDILSETAPATALIKEFNDVQVTDGFLSISFSAEVNNAKISALEVLPPNAFDVSANITILSPADNWDVNQPFEVAFQVADWEISQGDTYVQYFIDDVPIGPHYSYEPLVIDGLTEGVHTIRLELFESNDTATGIFDQVTVNVTQDLSCNESPWPDSWQVHELTEGNLAHRSVYILPEEDLDGDGLKDIVTGAWWFKNPGSASGDWQQNTIGSPFNNVAYIHDFDGDGDLDLFGTTGSYIGDGLAWAENDGSGNFTVHQNIPEGAGTYSEVFLAGIAGGVFQAGGPFQLAINWNGAEGNDDPMQLLTPAADPVNQTWTLEDIPGVNSMGEDLNAGDIDGDGDLDLFQGTDWIRNDGGGNWTQFTTGMTYVTTMDRNMLADFDRDGDLDAVAGQLGRDNDPDRFEFAWFEAPSDPTQPWTKRVLATDITGSLSVDVADMDYDGDLDIIVGEYRNEYRLIAFENDLCNSGGWIRQTLDAGGGSFDHHDGAQITDIDNDGDLDVVSIGWFNIVPRIFENTTISNSNEDPIADAGEDQLVTLPEDSITLNGSGSDPDGGTITNYAWTQQSGPSPATLGGDDTPTMTASNLEAGSYVFRLTVTDDEGASGFDEVTVTVNDPLEILRINAGGPEVSFDGRDWREDTYFSGGTTYFRNVPISNTEEDDIFQSERNAPTGTLTYEIPLVNGEYNINLHFAEIFFGLPGNGSTGGAGSRIFDIDIEDGQVTFNDFDIFAQSGGAATSIVLHASLVNVSDGSLTIVLTTEVENPKISGIEVINASLPTESPVANAGDDQQIFQPANSTIIDGYGLDPDGGPIVSYQWSQIDGPNTASMTNTTTDNLSVGNLIVGTYIFRLVVTDDEGESAFDEVSVNVSEELYELRINSGGPELDFDGQIWIADTYFSGGSTYAISDPISNTTNDLLYQSERLVTSGDLIYEIPIENGDYVVNLHFAEIFFGMEGNGSDGGVGSRVFNIDIENGQQTLDSFDIYEQAGGAAIALVQPMGAVQVSDGILTIRLTGVVQNPKISGIEVLGAFQPLANAGEDQVVVLPVTQTSILGTGSDPDGGDVSFSWEQVSGPNTANLNGGSTDLLDVSGLIEGEYIFRLTVTDDEGQTASDEMTLSVLPDSNQAPLVDAGADETIQLPVNSTILFGSATDPDGGEIATYIWTQESGPSDAVLTGTESPTLNVADLVVGLYVFRLTATDDEGDTGFDEVTITVDADSGTDIPEVDAGEDQTVILPESQVLLVGSATDPDGGEIQSYLWTQESGPGTATLSGENTEELTASDLIEGIYIFRLTATDDEGSEGFDEVSVTVTGDPNSVPPTVDAGPDQEILLPDDQALLTGSASDPDGGEIISYTWSQESGPNTATLSGEDTAGLTVTDLIEGTYVFRLTVVDDEGSSNFDDVNIIVSSETSGDLEIYLESNPAGISEFNGRKSAVVRIRNRPSSMRVFGIRIFDYSGKLIRSYLADGPYMISEDTFVLPIDDLNTGVYLLQVENNRMYNVGLKLLISN